MNQITLETITHGRNSITIADLSESTSRSMLKNAGLDERLICDKSILKKKRERQILSDINHDAIRPVDVLPKRKLNMLITSPGYESQADSMSPWHVVRWCTDLRIDVILIEHEANFQNWGPIGTQKKPGTKGSYFKAFTNYLSNIGFELHWTIMKNNNGLDRLVMIGRSDGKPIEVQKIKKGKHYPWHLKYPQQ